MHIEITIPCHNEEHRLAAGFATLCDWILKNRRQHRHEISLVIADNGSTDAAPAIAQKLVAASPVPARFLRIERAGLALALRAAWDTSNAEIVGYCDADMATDLAHLPEVFEKFADEKTVAVNGSRRIAGAIVSGRNRRRKVASAVLAAGIRRLTELRETDIGCGFKFFRRAWYATKSKNLFSEKFFLGAELFDEARRDNLRVAEIPVRWQERAGSRIRMFSAMRDYWTDIKKLNRKHA